MHRFFVPACVIVTLVSASVFAAQDTAQTNAASGSSDQREVLRTLAGEWNYSAEATMEPGQPPITCEGTASGRTVGEHWIVLETKGEILGMETMGIMTLGYNAEKQYIGTWIDSMQAHMYYYEGTWDDSGKVLSLTTKGPDPNDPTSTVTMKDVLEFKDNDHIILTSSAQMGDEWVQFMTATYERKK